MINYVHVTLYEERIFPTNISFKIKKEKKNFKKIFPIDNFHYLSPKQFISKFLLFVQSRTRHNVAPTMANYNIRRCFTERVIPYSYLSTILSTARLTWDVSISFVVQLTLTTVVQTDSNQQNRFAITFNGFARSLIISTDINSESDCIITALIHEFKLEDLKITSNFHMEFVSSFWAEIFFSWTW